VSLLTAVSDAMGLCLGTTPTSVVGNSDGNVITFLAQAQREVNDTWPQFKWSKARVAFTITGDGATTLWSLPSDFERFEEGNTFWSTMFPSVPLIGPILENDLLALKALPVTPLRPVWHLYGSKLEIWPALASGEVVNAIYYTTYPIVASDGSTAKQRWTADTDLPAFPESVLTNGMIWRWKKDKGRDYAEDFRTWREDRELMAAHQHGGKIVSTTAIYTLPSNQWPGIVTVTP